MNRKRLLGIVPLAFVGLVAGCNRDSSRTLSEGEAGKLLPDLYDSKPAVRRSAAESLAQPGVKMPSHFNFGPKLVGFLSMLDTDASSLALEGKRNASLPPDDQYGIVYVIRATESLFKGGTPADTARGAAHRFAKALGMGELDGEPARLACDDMDGLLQVINRAGMSEEFKKALIADLDHPMTGIHRLQPSEETARRIDAVRKKIEAIAVKPLTRPQPRPAAPD